MKTSRKVVIHYVCPLCKQRFSVLECACKRGRALGIMAEYHKPFCPKRYRKYTEKGVE